jgi:hypothetical protein
MFNTLGNVTLLRSDLVIGFGILLYICSSELRTGNRKASRSSRRNIATTCIAYKLQNASEQAHLCGSGLATRALTIFGEQRLPISPLSWKFAVPQAVPPHMIVPVLSGPCPEIEIPLPCCYCTATMAFHWPGLYMWQSECPLAQTVTSPFPSGSTFLRGLLPA